MARPSSVTETCQLTASKGVWIYTLARYLLASGVEFEN